MFRKPYSTHHKIILSQSRVYVHCTRIRVVKKLPMTTVDVSNITRKFGKEFAYEKGTNLQFTTNYASMNKYVKEYMERGRVRMTLQVWKNVKRQ